MSSRDPPAAPSSKWWVYSHVPLCPCLHGCEGSRLMLLKQALHQPSPQHLLYGSFRDTLKPYLNILLMERPSSHGTTASRSLTRECHPSPRDCSFRASVMSQHGLHLEVALIKDRVSRQFVPTDDFQQSQPYVASSFYQCPLELPHTGPSH